MDFTKFISMLDSSSLYFTRADHFEDPFEGATTDAILQKRNSLYTNFFDVDEAREKILAESNMYRNLRLQYAINCWHENEHESAAMWKLYLQSSEGVAICSTFSKLKQSFNYCGRNINLGRVKYIDFKTDDITEGHYTDQHPIVYKRKSFEHEREIRAVIWEPGEVDFDALMEKGGKKPIEAIKHGLQIQTDLQELINTVYVAPNAPGWFRDLVEQMILRYSYKIEVIQSSLYTGAMF